MLALKSKRIASKPGISLTWVSLGLLKLNWEYLLCLSIGLLCSLKGMMHMPAL